MSTKKNFDVAIIGAGVIGCSVAYALARRGHSVCVVDRGPGAGSGSTSASSAVVRFNYSTFVGVASAWEAKQAWLQWQDHLGGTDDAGMARFIQTGGLTLESPGQDRDKVITLFDQVGVPYEEWDAVTLEQRLPMLDAGRYYPPKRITDPAFWREPNGKLTGYWTPDSGFVDDPQLAAHNLMVAASRNGAEFRFRAPVRAIEQSQDRVSGLTIEDGERIHAPIVVNVAGPHSHAVNRMAGVIEDFAVTTRPMRQEVHEVRAPSGYNVHGPGPLIADLDLGTYFRGTPAGGLLVGGTEPECDPLQWLNDADDADPRATKQVYEAQLYRAARRVPTLTVPDAPRGVAGVYDVSDDWIPIYDKTRLPGYYVAIGTSGNQFKNAPIVGEFMAAIITATEAGEDHDLRPVQLTLPMTGHTINLGHYSRRRPINRTSSFTVMG